MHKTLSPISRYSTPSQPGETILHGSVQHTEGTSCHGSYRSDTHGRILDKEPESPKPLKEFNDRIEYKHVDFAYRADHLVLKDISLTIPKGKTIALVGQSGSGKSTFVDLLPRFYDVVKGEIRSDGINIKDTSTQNLRALMGNVNPRPDSVQRHDIQ